MARTNQWADYDSQRRLRDRDLDFYSVKLHFATYERSLSAPAYADFAGRALFGR